MDIHIPPAALEAGARHGYGNFDGWLHLDPYDDPIAWEELTEEQRDEYRQMVRAAFEAMVEAWEGMHTHEWQRPWLGGMSGTDLILPLPPPPAGETND